MCVDRDSSVGIVTRYGMDGPGIESRWGVIFRAHPHRPYTVGTGSFPTAKQPRRGFYHPPLTNTEVKETVEQLQL